MTIAVYTTIREAFGLDDVGSSTSTSALICLEGAESNFEVKPTLDRGPGGPREIGDGHPAVSIENPEPGYRRFGDAGFEQRRLVAPEGDGEAVGDLHGANPDEYRIEVLRRGGGAV